MGLSLTVTQFLRDRTLSKFRKLLLVLIRLRFNLPLQYLAYRFNIHAASRAFINVINVMDTRLVPSLIVWPEREQLRLTRAQTWSNYKSHNSIKYLISICPQRVITSISKGWGGRVSDKHLTENCGLLRNLNPGDVVLADRGFNMHTSV